MTEVATTELQVIVQQEPGTIRWNFEQLKAALMEKLAIYEAMTYTDDTVRDAKKDVAMLRKLRNVVDTRRKEIRERCLEPYQLIEQQASELTGLIDRPIFTIDKQVKDYEARRRAEKKKTIIDHMTQVFSDLPEAIAKKLQFKIYDPRWENATAKAADYKQAVEAAHTQTAGDITILNDVEEEFRDKAFQVYGQNLVLRDALAKVAELRRQKEEILERERRRAEEEHRKVEETAKAQESPEPTPSEPLRTVRPAAPTMAEVVESIERSAFAAAFTPPPVKKPGRVLRIVANDAQYAKICGFIKYIGATFEEVEA